MTSFRRSAKLRSFDSDSSTSWGLQAQNPLLERHDVLRGCNTCGRIFFLLVGFLIVPTHLHSQEVSSLEKAVLERVDRDPESASNWRLLAKFRRKRNDLWGAIQAYEQALHLAPNHVSAHFDLATTLLELNNPIAASRHFQNVVDIAPESEYGLESMHHLQSLGQAQIRQASFMADDRDPNRFGGAPVEVERLQRSIRFYAEFGAQYNSNVQLAPLSRVVVLPGQGSFQGFLAPQVEVVFYEGAEIRDVLGAIASGYFNVNESQFTDFNLQEYLGGLFYELEFDNETYPRVLRIQYDFALNEFAGSTFATRHSLTTMLSTLHDDDAETAIAWTIDHTDFRDDGFDPSVDSLDGWTNTLGVSHTRYLRYPTVDSVRIGSDVQWAPLQGADFAYRGVFVYGQTESNLPLEFKLVLQFGWGYRDYSRFTTTPSRDENLWRAGVELRRTLANCWEIVGFYAYDRFSTDNEDFDTSRTTTGIMTTVDY